MILKDNINKEDFLDYINTNWKTEEDKIWIKEYSSEYKNLGNSSIGLYDNDLLIGFIYYNTNSRIPYWYKATQKKLNLIDYNNLWENNLLEINKNYRFNGYGSMLIQEVYKRMPDKHVLISMSEYTDNHINFYRKNGFIQNKLYKHPSFYLFFKIKDFV